MSNFKWWVWRVKRFFGIKSPMPFSKGNGTYTAPKGSMTIRVQMVGGGSDRDGKHKQEM